MISVDLTSDKILQRAPVNIIFTDVIDIPDIRAAATDEMGVRHQFSIVMRLTICSDDFVDPAVFTEDREVSVDGG